MNRIAGVALLVSSVAPLGACCWMRSTPATSRPLATEPPPEAAFDGTQDGERHGTIRSVSGGDSGIRPTSSAHASRRAAESPESPRTCDPSRGPMRECADVPTPSRARGRFESRWSMP